MPAKRGQKKTRKTANRKPQTTPAVAAAPSVVPAAAKVTLASKKSKLPQLSLTENARARYPYVQAELKRIGVLAAIMLALLIALFVILS